MLGYRDQWYMFGFFLGDGCLIDENKNKLSKRIVFAINRRDKDKVLPRLQKILNLKQKEYRDNCYVFRCYCSKYSQILDHFGKYAYGKKIPEWLQNAPKKYIKEFIDGYRDADGCYRRDKNGNIKSTRFTTISYNIAYGIQRLLLKLGH